MTTDFQPIPSSFRDPCGFVFKKEGQIYRHLSPQVREDFDHFISSKLYDDLIKQKFIVAHEEVENPDHYSPGAWKVIRPEIIPFLSWPYEWSFHQLKAAALLTLEIAIKAFDKGMTLKDASAYNVQFIGTKPIFIDTLSLTKWKEGQPWIGYRQFCEHFLAPLALASYCDRRYLKMQRVYLEGTPLDFASQALPKRTKLSPGLLAHIHLHAKFQHRHSDDQSSSSGTQKKKMTSSGYLGILDSLKSLINKMKPYGESSHWSDYYNATNYSDDSFNTKKELVREFLQLSKPERVWDVGSNTGVFSEVAAEFGCSVIAFEGDEVASDVAFQRFSQNKNQSILPIVMDLTNPSPDQGWDQCEREGMTSRAPADCMLALALIHHLAIAHNLPLSRVAQTFSKWTKDLIIEFVPKTDSQVKRLLSTREDIFPHYDFEGFESAFCQHFEIITKKQVGSSDRVLYLMKNLVNG